MKQKQFFIAPVAWKLGYRVAAGYVSNLKGVTLRIPLIIR